MLFPGPTNLVARGLQSLFHDLDIMRSHISENQKILNIKNINHMTKFEAMQLDNQVNVLGFEN